MHFKIQHINVIKNFLNSENLVEKNKYFGNPSPKAEAFKLWLAKMGGHTAKVAREDIEKSLGETVITSRNVLKYKYLNNNKKELKGE